MFPTMSQNQGTHAQFDIDHQQSGEPDDTQNLMLDATIMELSELDLESDVDDQEDPEEADSEETKDDDDEDDEM
jgi:hypothetical protein